MSSSNSSNEKPDDDDLSPPREDEGDGHTNDKLRRPGMRSDLFSQPLPSNSQPMPSEPLQNYGPHFDASMDSGVCTTPAWLGTINPGSDRDVSSSGRSRSHRGSHPSDADYGNVPLKAHLWCASQHAGGSHPPDADSECSPVVHEASRSRTDLRPAGVRSSDGDSERSRAPSHNATNSSTVSFESDRSG